MKIPKVLPAGANGSFCPNIVSQNSISLDLLNNFKKKNFHDDRIASLDKRELNGIFEKCRI